MPTSRKNVLDIGSNFPGFSKLSWFLILTIIDYYKLLLFVGFIYYCMLQ